MSKAMSLNTAFAWNFFILQSITGGTTSVQGYYWTFALVSTAVAFQVAQCFVDPDDDAHGDDDVEEGAEGDDSGTNAPSQTGSLGLTMGQLEEEVQRLREENQELHRRLEAPGVSPPAVVI